MTKPRKERCETCRFWDKGEVLIGRIAYCCRLPPVAVKWEVVDKLNGENPHGVWPVTYDVHWCGEWQGECPVKADKCLSIQEVAERIGITTGQAARLVKQMRCVRINRTTVAVTETSLAKWIETNTEEPATE